jgi:hypothetical protein
MPIPREALALEDRNIGIAGEPTLAAAYTILKAEWDNGKRDRELGLHLMFIAWYGIIEPSHITGFTEAPSEKHELNDVLFDVHEFLKDKIDSDAEILFAFGLMARMFWYMLEHDKYWEQIGNDYQKRYRQLLPEGLDRAVFAGRGAYGEYYAGQIEASNLPNGF